MKKIKLLCITLLLSVNSFAQFTGIDTFEENWIKPLFPVLAGIIFIVGALMNMGNFFGENRDIKKGVVNILIYMGVILVIAGIYTTIRNTTLG